MPILMPFPAARAAHSLGDPSAALLLLHPFAGTQWWVGASVITAQAVLLLAVVIAYRRRGVLQRALDERLRSERVISELSSDFVHAPSARIDVELERWLTGILPPFGLDRAEIRLFAGPDAPSNQVSRDLVFCSAEIRHGRVVLVRSLDQLPPEAEVDCRALEAAGVRSLLAVPLSVSGRTLGFLAVYTTRRERAWTEELVRGIQLVGEVFAGALARRDAEAALRSRDAMSTAVLGSLTAAVAVLDRWGTILQVNPAWLDSGADLPSTGVNYLGFLRAAPGLVAEGMHRAVEQVLNGESVEDQRIEYCRTLAEGDRWHELVVTPLRVAGGGAVVAHTDCTARKRAEAEAVRHRTEAAHAARAATLGELAAGLAHELNQPLGAILTNVQAARRLVRLVPPQTDLLSEILDDVAADDLRASEIIRRMRALLRKGELDFQPVDVNEITHDVLRLVASDAILRQVRVIPQFEPDLPGVVGDRVQLQQVILNLVVNAMEAMASVPMERRRLVVRTSHPKPMLIQVAVQDQGPGFSPDVLRRMYDPFFSTKPDGLGMGLSISRSIIDAHGGRVRAFNNPAGGAIVSFTLPVYLADEGAPRRIVNAGPAKEQTPDGVQADSLRR
jgi:two-component system, LuxR family, sensor kinase FixL